MKPPELKFRDKVTMKVYNIDQIKIRPDAEYEVINEKGRVIDYVTKKDIFNK